MRPRFTEHDVLAAADLEDERAYLDRAYAIHLALAHGAAGRDLVAANVVHPDGHASVGLGRAGSDALSVSVPAARSGRSELLRVGPAPLPPPDPHLSFPAPATSAPATGPRPGTLCLLAGAGNPP